MTSTGAEAGAEHGRRLQPFASFRIRDYRWLWAANVCHSLALGTQGFAFAWLIIETLDKDYSNDWFRLTLVIPALLLGLLAGLRIGGTGACC